METKAEVMKAVAAVGLNEFAAEIEAQIWPSIRISYPEQPAPASGIGQSRIGGLPDLPIGVEWPTASGYDRHHFDRVDPLLFLAQINLADVTPYDIHSLLPHSGLLLFFAASWVNVLSEYRVSQGLWRVIYTEDLENLRPASPPELPEGLNDDEDYPDNAPTGHAFRSSALAFSLEMTIPQAFEHPTIERIRSTEKDNEAFWDLKKLLYPETEDDLPINHPPTHRMLGHAQLDQVFSPNSNSILLLQLGSEIRSPRPADASDIYWEFGGTGCFFIEPDALRNRDFSDIEFVYETD